MSIRQYPLLVEFALHSRLPSRPPTTTYSTVKYLDYRVKVRGYKLEIKDIKLQNQFHNKDIISH